MVAARPLKDVFADLTGDDAARSEAALAAGGHGDLPADLVAEAVVSYADTAPVEVAEHLSPFVMAHSGVPVEADDPADWAQLLATAPPVDGEGLDDVGLGGPDTVDGMDGVALGGPDTVEPAGADDVDFGRGAEDVDEPVVMPATADAEPVEAVAADAPEPQEFDGEVFDTAAPVDLSDVDDLDGDDVDPAELDG